MVKMVNRARNLKLDTFKGPTKIALKIDVSMLNMIIGSLFKQSRQVNRKSLSNIRKLFNIIDETIYLGNDAITTRLHFIHRALDARLDSNMENEDVIINFCREGDNSEEVENIIRGLPAYKKISYDELKSINKMVADRINFSYLHIYKDRLYNAIEKLDSGDYDSFAQINKEVTGIAQELIAESRKVNVVEDTLSFSLTDDFEQNITSIVERLKNPANILRTGIRWLNLILAPGLQARRLYLFMGLPGGFKSGMLLKLMNDIRKYNRDTPPKKEGYRKTVLMITQENTVDESVERLFNMVVTSESIRNFTPKKVIELLKREGGLTVNTDDDIDIVIQYYANRTIDTSDLYTIMEELQDERREIIALIHDYIKRIRPAEYGKDEKEELKNVTNELKSLAIDFDIPVVTAHQLNRAAAAALDAAIAAGKMDAGKYIGRSNAGSAWEVMENVDVAININLQRHPDTKQLYLSFSLLKIRYKPMTDMDFFSHPFEAGDGMRLVDDIGMESSVSIKTMQPTMENVNLDSYRESKRNATTRRVVEETTEEKNDIFSALFKKELEMHAS